jgi:SpoVK/Ycf46/Vps4 family AAA+-type ATPase
MEINQNTNPIDLVSIVFKKAKNSELSDSFFLEIDSELIFLSKYFSLSKNQTFLLCMFINLNYKNDCVDIFDLGEYLDCPALTLLKFKNDFDELEDKGFVSKSISNHRMNLERANNQYIVKKEISASLVNNQPIVLQDIIQKHKNDFVILEEMCHLLENRNKLEDFQEELVKTMKKKLIQNQDRPLFAWIVELKLENYDLVVYVYLIWTSLLNRTGDLTNLLEKIFSNNAKMLEYNHKIVLKSSKLFELNLVILHKSRRNEGLKLSSFSNRKLIELEILPDFRGINKIYEKEFDFFDKVLEVFCQEDESYGVEEETSNNLEDVKKIYENHKAQFPILKHLTKLKLGEKDLFIIMLLIAKKLIGKNKVEIDEILKKVCYLPSEKHEVSRLIRSKKSQIIKLEYVDISKANFFGETCLEITSKFDEILRKNNVPIEEEKEENTKDLLLFKDIKKKTLYYDKSEIAQITNIKDILDKNSLQKLQKRLSDKALPTGVNILLYGAPGTGKTESVYQIAKATGRNIMKVEISQSKSMWFGESEKIIKRIFTKYNQLVESSKRTPILFFNEADAIISKRKENTTNVSQTENAIQNILLEELENFKGILFATTNLESNLDKAFERRFLYKIKFELPSVGVKSQIWESKINFLKEEEAQILAVKYAFSGGQIENVVRKIEINELLNSKYPNFDEIQQFCEDEMLASTREINKIGFKN